MRSRKASLALAFALAIPSAPALAACTIPSSPCYPWRIESGESESLILEIVPNNAQTFALYRVCLCPPGKGISLVFDFEGKQVTLGTLELGSGEPVCRDWRLATARKSRLLVKRTGADGSKLEGCYTTQ